MPDSNKRLIVIGDRVLIAPEEGEDRGSIRCCPSCARAGHHAQRGRPEFDQSIPDDLAS